MIGVHKYFALFLFSMLMISPFALTAGEESVAMSVFVKTLTTDQLKNGSRGRMIVELVNHSHKSVTHVVLHTDAALNNRFVKGSLKFGDFILGQVKVMDAEYLTMNKSSQHDNSRWFITYHDVKGVKQFTPVNVHIRAER